MAEENARFADLVGEHLRRAGYKVESEPSIGGVRPDFVVVPEGGGEEFVIEAKNWQVTPSNVARAHREADYFSSELGRSRVLIVVPDAPADFEDTKVVSLARLQERVTLESQAARNVPVAAAPVESPRPTMFVAMPFAAEYDDLYFVAMTYAADHCGLSAYRGDQDLFAGDIIARLKEKLASAKLMVADVSGANPNVMYELGMADGLGLPTVLVTSAPQSEAPFDIRNTVTLPYSRGGTYAFREQLAAHVKAVVQTR